MELVEKEKDHSLEVVEFIDFMFGRNHGLHSVSVRDNLVKVRRHDLIHKIRSCLHYVIYNF